MNKTTWLYAINGKAMLIPDAGVQTDFSDILSIQSGRDEAGYMHRVVKRSKVGSWRFTYSTLSQEGYQYMLGLLNAGDTFDFTYPDPTDPAQPKTVRAYIEKYGIGWYSARQGLYRNLKFDVVEC